MIKRLRVKGFKSLYDLDLTFSPLTVLFGTNTSGKSNVLDVIQLLARSVTAEHIADIFDAPFRGSLLSCFSLGDDGHIPENAKIEITVDLSGSFSSGSWDLPYKDVRYELVLGYAPERFPCVLHEALYDIAENQEICLFPLWLKGDIRHAGPTLLSEFKSMSYLHGASLGDMALPLAVAQEIKSWRVFALDPQSGLRAINVGLLAMGDTNKPRGVIGIEEPEKGLHPSKMGLLARLLETQATDNQQLIVTTHLPHLLDHVPLASIYVCQKENGKTGMRPVTDLSVISCLSDDILLSDLIVSGALNG